MSEVTLSYPRVLTIAGSDSGGGAGIQADIKTIAALGCYGMSAITALTVQNTLGVSGIHNVPVDVVRAQIDAVVDDIGIDAVKIGMLHSEEVIRIVAQAVDEKRMLSVVLDPVMVSSAGSVLIDDGAKEALVKHLFSKVALITPNLDEAGLLLGRVIKTSGELVQAAYALAGMGASAVLLKGAHLQEADVLDVLVMQHDATGAVELYELTSPRIYSHNLHGAGCTLSAAIASYLALGLDLPGAVQAARVYVMAAIEAGVYIRTGQGIGPLNHTCAPQAMKLKDRQGNLH